MRLLLWECCSLLGRLLKLPYTLKPKIPKYEVPF